VKAPSLEQILALKPEGVDAVGMQAAIGTATELRQALATRIAEIEDILARPALEITDREFEQGRREAEVLQLADRRIAELIPQMEAELAHLKAEATMAELQAQAQPVTDAVAALERWLDADLAKISAILTKGFALQEQAVSLRRAFADRVDEAYRDLELRKLGSLGAELPQLPETMPRNLFPNWS
jgi:type I site-specific restriction endonuclease